MSGTLTYSQSTGIIRDKDGAFVALGWAGHGEGKNNPAKQAFRALGPLPQGLYRVGPWGNSETVKGYPARLGPMIASLTQIEGATFGRDDFFIHGPASAESGEQGRESKGCIVTWRTGRQRVKNLDPEFVRVLA